jgi:DNA-binding response OmpR family regulator
MTAIMGLEKHEGVEQNLLGLQRSLGVDNGQRRLVLFQFDDSRLEYEWSTSLVSWGIACETVESHDDLMSRLQVTQVVLFNVQRVGAFPFSLIADKRVPLIAIGKDMGTILKAQLLESGVEDCIETTCNVREMVARVRAILCRSKWAEAKGNLNITPSWRFDLVLREVYTPNGARVRLNEIEFDLLRALSKLPDKIFAADELIEAVFVDRHHRSKDRLARAIRKIRSKLMASSEAHLIQTIQHKGYRLRDEFSE